jgi:hypothetical protein
MVTVLFEALIDEVMMCCSRRWSIKLRSIEVELSSTWLFQAEVDRG